MTSCLTRDANAPPSFHETPQILAYPSSTTIGTAVAEISNNTTMRPLVASAVLLVLSSLAACAVQNADPSEVGSASGELHGAPKPNAAPHVGELARAADPTIAHARLDSCAGDAECDDGDPCNGAESCDAVTHRCHGAKVVDADGDGVAPIALSAGCKIDCDDGNAKVHPGQLAFFGEPFATASGALSYDYDCDGVEQPGNTDLGYCIGAATIDAETCWCAEGWLGGVPSCGAAADFATPSKCGEARTSTPKQQTCR